MASAIAVVKRFARHLARIRYRLLLINLIVAAVPIVGISFANMHERQLLAALEQDMIHQAQLVRAAIATDPTRSLEAHQAVLVTAAKNTRTRIRILDAKGAIRADSHRGGPPEGAERPVPQLFGESPTHPPEVPKSIDLASRPEVRAAIDGRYGSATRLWDNQDRVYLFSALPVTRTHIGPPAKREVIAIVYITRSTHDVKLQLYALRTWLVRLLIASIAGTALLTLLLATTIARPLGQLTRRAKRIAARQPVEAPRGGDRLTKRRDEVGELARAVATMTTELERRAHDARTLAADISHEFKTPLTGIRGAAELLRDGAAEDPEARDRFLAMIVDDTARLDRLVSRLLELARVDDDRTTQLPVDLAGLARQSSTARPWPVPVEISADEDCVVAGRSAALGSAIDNLVANATQHADPETRVTVAITRERDRIRIAVSNHGPALSATARTKVWDRFYSTRHAEGGSGLGLAIVRSVALAHSGNVGVDCDEGVTTFWFEVARSA